MSFRDGRRTRPGIPRFRFRRCASPRNDSLENGDCFRMPVVLDPDAAAVYKAFQEAGRPAYETLTPPEAREFYNQARFVSNPEPPALESAKDVAIPAPHGTIPARLYTPKTLRKKDGVAPCLVFFHGGGWVIGNLETHDVVCRKLAHEGELLVLSVDYRLAPEHRFPAAVEDCITATKWAADHAKELRRRYIAPAGRRRQRRRQHGGRFGDRRTRRPGAQTRRAGADLSLDRFLAQPRLSQGSLHLDPADAFGDHLVRGQLYGWRR